MFKAVSSEPDSILAISDTLGLFVRKKKMEDVLNILAQNSARSSDGYERLILMCFVYQIASEGIFDESLKFLAILSSLWKKVPLLPESVENEDAKQTSY